MTDFKATPDQWDRIRRWGRDMGSCRDACILELLSRIEVLEIAENDRRYRECSALIDKATSEQIRAALEGWDG